MKMRKLGNTDLWTPPIMFGGNVFGWTLDEKASFRMLDHLLDRGFTFIDTANTYGNKPGLSEQIIGKWMKERKARDRITIATKAGRTHQRMPDGSVVKGKDNSAKHLIRAAETSLKNLQTDYIDLYYTHFDDEEVSVIEPLRVYGDLMDQGKVRYIGASNFSPGRLAEAMEASDLEAIARYQVFQTEYNLMERVELEQTYRPVCEKYGISITSYFSLAAGFLSGKYRSKEDFKGAARQKMTEKYWNERGQKVLKTLDRISKEYGVSNSAIAIAWILEQSFVTSAIVSATKESHLDAFEEAMNVNLSEESWRQLEEVSRNF